MEKIICSNCKAPFYLVKDNIKRICPKCNFENSSTKNKLVSSNEKKNKYEGRVQLISKSSYGTNLVFTNQSFNSKGITYTSYLV